MWWKNVNKKHTHKQKENFLNYIKATKWKEMKFMQKITTSTNKKQKSEKKTEKTRRCPYFQPAEGLSSSGATVAIFVEKILHHLGCSVEQGGGG